VACRSTPRGRRRDFGGVDQTKEAYRGQRGFMVIDELVQDVRFAARMLWRSPLFGLTAVMSLGIGIGATTSVFTVANALLFHVPAGVREHDRLVDIGSGRFGNGFGNSSYPNYLDLRQRATTLDGVYAQQLFPRSMSFRPGERGSPAESLFATFVTTNYFNVLGATPVAGRLFDAGDREEPGAAPVAVLSFRFWSRRFNRDPGVVGRTLMLDGRPFAVIGVAAEGFQGTGIRAGDAWVPISMTAASQTDDQLRRRYGAWLLMGARLKPGVTRAQTAAEADAIGRALEREHPEENRGTGFRVAAVSPVPGNGPVVMAFLALLMAVVTVVLVITCANLAGVLLARASARRTEIAVRLALGAGRARLVRQLLVETLCLCTVGGAAGLVVARGLTSLAVSRLPRCRFRSASRLRSMDASCFSRQWSRCSPRSRPV
jgi:predicted permease